MFTCSIGIMVYNESANIGSLLDALLHQKLKSGIIKEIVVVASGCTDNTEEIVKQYSQKNRKVKLLVQEKREGKASAINYYLSRTKTEIAILESGDTLPQDDTIEKLICRFKDPQIGMVGGHPIPVNDKNCFLGYTVHLLWHLHHLIASKHPKCGELVAFRNKVSEIPISSAVDEASIEALITEAGYTLQYAPDAIVWNKGPDTITDFIAQRRRIAAGHVNLKQTEGYSVSTSNSLRILVVLIKDQLMQLLWTFGGIFLEAYGRILGFKDCYIKRRDHRVWKIAESTKRDIKVEHDKSVTENTTVSTF